MRDLAAVNAPPVTTMSCEDARDCFPALLRGKLGLTEWVLVDAHLRRCAPCGQEEARVRQLAGARRVASLARAMEVTGRNLIDSTTLISQRGALLTVAAVERGRRALGVATQAADLGIGRSTALIARFRTWLAMGLERTATVVADSISAIGGGITVFVAGIARLGAVLAIALGSSGRAVADATQAARPGIVRSVRRVFRQLMRAAAVVLALAFALYALQRSEGPGEQTRPPAPLDREIEPTQAARVGPEPTKVPVLPPPSVEQESAARARSRVDGSRQSPARAAALSSVHMPAFEARVSPEPADEPLASTSHVVGHLAAGDRGGAERELTALLRGVGGAELGRRPGPRLTTLEVVVPQARYQEFASGLARIGSWRLEAARSPLPDPVHMTIRVSG